MQYPKKDTLLLWASLTGLVLAGLSGASEHVAWLQSICTGFSDGCRETAKFTLWGFPVWGWGAGFYVVLAASALFAGEGLIWLVSIAIGVEITLVAIMAQLGVVCVYCLGNAVVVVVLAVALLRAKNFWQFLALALLGFMVSAVLLGRENRIPLWQYFQQPTAGANGPGRPAVPASAPEDPRITAEITPGDSQVLGPETAPVTVYAYTDFRCPACRRHHPVVQEAMKLYGDKVRWVFKNFPLPMHKDAEIAAEGAQCAAGQDAFWKYQDALFAYQEDFTPESLEAIAGSLGLDTAKFRQCLDSHATRQQVEKEVEEGVRAGLNAVPCVVINGTIYAGSMPLKTLQALIDEALIQQSLKKPGPAAAQ